ncbi:hypothetical protein MKW92_052625 [Papaver armeniacum]|nr:hypothetical protein MKW92_052625 [Papaver armeniacum]
MREVYIPQLDRMLHWLGFKILQLKLDEDEFLRKYTMGLKIERYLLQISQGHCRYAMDDLICWEKRIVGFMNFASVMAALKLPGDQWSQLQIPQLKHHDSNQNNTLIDQKSHRRYAMDDLIRWEKRLGYMKLLILMAAIQLPAGTLLNPANLPSYALYSCSPLASSDLPRKPEYQQNVVLSSLPKDGNIRQMLVSSFSTPVISDSPLNENCAYLEFDQGGGTEAIINPGINCSTVVFLQVKTSDKGARSSFPEEVVSTTRCCRCFSIESSLNALPLEYNENTGCKKVNALESSEKLKSVATFGIKKSRLEMNHALLGEVREINHVLINTKLGIDDECISLMSAAGEDAEGTIVNCTFSPIYGSSTEKFPALPMWFLIPAKYLLLFPVLLDSLVLAPAHMKNLITEAWIKFYELLRCMPEPTSLKEMAKSWDSCANAVFSEYARRMQK